MMDLAFRENIRAAYKEHEPLLKKGVRLSPYSLGVDWMGVFSPIEDAVWGAIRYLGLPLYPQYPVGKFFIDFADVRRKIGIEIDSIKWHRDKEKDRVRQRWIESQGWDIYRIPSLMVWKNRDDFEDDEYRVNIEKYATESAEGFLWKLYYDNGFFTGDERVID